ncbi:MAG: M16 family metallopeptidase [Polyangiales bacterium]
MRAFNVNERVLYTRLLDERTADEVSNDMSTPPDSSSIRSSRLSHSAIAASLLVVAACGSAPHVNPPTPIVVAPVVLDEEAPKTTSVALSADIPATGPAKSLVPAKVFPIDGLPLKGLGIASSNLPIVHLKIAVRAGSSTSFVSKTKGKSRAGIAELTAKLMKDGGAGAWDARALAAKIDALGTELTVDVGLDAVTFGIAVTKDKIDAALEILSSVVLRPRFDGGEFSKLKTRQIDNAKQSLRSSGGFMASAALAREIYGGDHPYGDTAATDVTLGNIELNDVRAFYKTMYVGKNAFVVVAGDIEPKEIAGKLKRALATFSAAAAPTISFPAPTMKEGTRVVLAQKTDAKQADIFVSTPMIERSSAEWPQLQLATTILGGANFRLYQDVREGRSLAYSTYGTLRERAHGPVLLSLYAGTQVKKAPEAVVALLENLRWISGEKPPTSHELGDARTYLQNDFTFQLETIGSVAQMAISKEILGLPGDDVYGWVDGYRSALRDVGLPTVQAIAKDKMTPRAIVIAVAGDLHLLPPLTHFGPVRVVDPEHDFKEVATMAMDDKATLDVPLPPGVGTE